MKWYLHVLLANYANFNGRARRTEYWMFTLIQLIIVIVMGLMFSNIDDFLNLGITPTIILLYLAGTLVPWLALNVRRLHDIGKSGSYFFVNLIPIVGRIWYIIMMSSDGDSMTNAYGSNPKLPAYDELNDIGKSMIE